MSVVCVPMFGLDSDGWGAPDMVLLAGLGIITVHTHSRTPPPPHTHTHAHIMGVEPTDSKQSSATHNQNILSARMHYSRAARL